MGKRNPRGKPLGFWRSIRDLNSGGAVNALSHFECDLFDLLSNAPYEIVRLRPRASSGRMRDFGARTAIFRRGTRPRKARRKGICRGQTGQWVTPFRVTPLRPLEYCSLSWRRIPTPMYLNIMANFIYCVNSFLRQRAKSAPPQGEARNSMRTAETVQNSAPRVAAMTALMVCMRFSASWKTMLCLPVKTSSVTSMASRPNFSPMVRPTWVQWSW